MPLVLIKGLCSVVPASPPILTTFIDPEDSRDVSCRWQSPYDLPQTYVIGYILRFKSRDNTDIRTINVTSSTTEYVIEDVAGEATYDVMVTYMTKLGEGVSSKAVEVVIGKRRGVASRNVKFYRVFFRKQISVLKLRMRELLFASATKLPVLRTRHVVTVAWG